LAKTNKKSVVFGSLKFGISFETIVIEPKTGKTNNKTGFAILAFTTSPKMKADIVFQTSFWTPILNLPLIFELCDFTLQFENETKVYPYSIMGN
jgi:hypothetical protein